MKRFIIKPIIKAKQIFGTGIQRLKFKKKTETKDVFETISKNNKPMAKGICVICGT